MPSRPSPMALQSSSPQPSIFRKKSTPAMSTAASYLSAVSEADARARAHGGSPNSTPALSLSSSVTTSSSDTVLEDPGAEFEDALSYPRNPPTSEQVFTTVHSEFGHCANESYRYTSQHKTGTPYRSYPEQDPPYYILLTTYLSYLMVICLGHLRDFVGKRFRRSAYRHLLAHDGYAALNSDFDSFYTRRLKTRIDDCFSHPVTGVPGRTIMLLDRYSPDYNVTMFPSGTRTRGLNISSYNYLGFAQARGGCADAVEACINRYGVSPCGTRLEGGSLDLHAQAEGLVARFIGQEDSMICSMGFATNSTFNHASIRWGVRVSGANVRTFKHNNMKSLENLLREVISQGQPKTHRPWKKILVIVEGLFSMEGTLANLPVIMELKKKYKFYLFVDEAHSIGALGPHGRGSFGAAGGYIAGSKALVDRLRLRAHTGTYTEAMTPPVLMQVIASMASIMGISPTPSSGAAALEVAELERHPGNAPMSILPSWMPLSPTMVDGSDGRMRLRRIAFNSRYLNRGLRKLGFITYGCADSPVIPLLLFNPGKMAVFSRMMRTRAVPIVVVVVASAHTKEDMDMVLTACDEIGDLLDLKQGQGERWPLQEILDRAVELVNVSEES
ncbi:serine palmitoyltransferase 2 [Fomitopsis serialis]|uniref:serine palmitoyltransferase 2 n=1 Tax=Fomitopsis serialis TaxID=139415 RepID=UPI002008156B|nr:serine palmitoyltransferase 2 [Neoantrodia serialis]KAH9911583.1 serine palmitoyltransferase 2 [Neoantrodia serialis]